MILRAPSVADGNRPNIVWGVSSPCFVLLLISHDNNPWLVRPQLERGWDQSSSDSNTSSNKAPLQGKHQLKKERRAPAGEGERSAVELSWTLHQVLLCRLCPVSRVQSSDCVLCIEIALFENRSSKPSKTTCAHIRTDRQRLRSADRRAAAGEPGRDGKNEQLRGAARQAAVGEAGRERGRLLNNTTRQVK